MISRNLVRELAMRDKYCQAVSAMIHTTSHLDHESFKLKESIENSLWLTTLPQSSLRQLIGKNSKKNLLRPEYPRRKGPLIISCKNKERNFHKGTNYKKNEVVPLASKAWHHRKSSGDYFSILPTSRIPAFVLPKDFSKWSTSEIGELDGDEFKMLGVSPALVQRLNAMEIFYPTAVQVEAIPKILAGQNVMVTGETGCGKTLAYLIPMVEHIARLKEIVKNEKNSPFGMVIVPTRELAHQVGDVATQLTDTLDIKCKVVVANRTKYYLTHLNEECFENVDIVVTTLGVMCKYTFHKVYLLSNLTHLVIDEADTLLDDSFKLKMQALFKRCKFRFNGASTVEDLKSGAQLSLFSATFPREFDEILDNYIPSRQIHNISTEHIHKIQPHIQHNFIRCKKSNKKDEIIRLVKKDLKRKFPVIVFNNKTTTCNWLASMLRENGIDCARYNAHMKNDERLMELERFKEGAVDVLVCTDAASRGQNIPRVKHVVNYEFPKYMADYVHRSGRTGRIGNENGCEVTSLIASRSEVPLLNEIELSVRTGKVLSSVNNNITRIIKKRMERLGLKPRPQVPMKVKSKEEN